MIAALIAAAAALSVVIVDRLYGGHLEQVRKERQHLRDLYGRFGARAHLAAYSSAVAGSRAPETLAHSEELVAVYTALELSAPDGVRTPAGAVLDAITSMRSPTSDGQTPVEVVDAVQAFLNAARRDLASPAWRRRKVQMS